jgi:hypothetical protein
MAARSVTWELLFSHVKLPNRCSLESTPCHAEGAGLTSLRASGEPSNVRADASKHERNIKTLTSTTPILPQSSWWLVSGTSLFQDRSQYCLVQGRTLVGEFSQYGEMVVGGEDQGCYGIPYSSNSGTRARLLYCLSKASGSIAQTMTKAERGIDRDCFNVVACRGPCARLWQGCAC